jgi:hypothetical protein
VVSIDLLHEETMGTEINCTSKRIMRTRVLIVFVFIISSLSCSIFQNDAATPRGSGNVIQKAIPVKPFNQLTIEISVDVYIHQGEIETLIVEADEKLFPYLCIHVIDERLRLAFAKEVTNIYPSRPYKFNLVVKDLSSMTVSGSADVYSQGIDGSRLEVNLGGPGKLMVMDIRSEHVEINHTGSGEINVENLETGKLSLHLDGSGDIRIGSLHAQVIDVQSTGSGNVMISGEAVEQRINLIGSSDYVAGDLCSERIIVSMVATGKATVWATKTLDVRIAPGIGSIAYYGDPKLTIQSSDLKSIRALGEMKGRKNSSQDVQQ